MCSCFGEEEDTNAVGASISLTLNVAVNCRRHNLFHWLLVNNQTRKCQLWARSSPKSWINLFFNRISNEFTLKGIFTKAYSIKILHRILSYKTLLTALGQFPPVVLLQLASCERSSLAFLTSNPGIRDSESCLSPKFQLKGLVLQQITSDG